MNDLGGYLVLGNGMAGDLGFNGLNMRMKHIQGPANTVVIELRSGGGAKGLGVEAFSPSLDPVKRFGTHQPIENQHFQDLPVRNTQVPAASHRKVAIHGLGNLKPIQNRF